MYKIICNVCGRKSSFENRADKPDSCFDCYQPFDQIEIQEDRENSELVKENRTKGSKNKELTLIYLKTQGKIVVSNNPETILGRGKYGAEVLTDNRISREHCLIEFEDNEYKLSDLDSTHGTYAGVSKTDCKENPKCILKNNDLIFLGQEIFLVNIHNVKAESGEEETPDPDNESEQNERSEALVIKCLNCGQKFPNQEIIRNNPCEGCLTCGEWEEIDR